MEEGAALSRAVRSSKQILQCGMQQRSWSHFRDAVDLIQGGSLGAYARSEPIGGRTISFLGDQTSRYPGPRLETVLGGAPDQPFSEEKFYRWRWFWNFGGAP